MANFEAAGIAPLTVRETIKELIATQLATISITNGYETDLDEVFLDQRGILQTKSFPCVSIIDRGDRDSRLVQGIYEGKMLLEFRTQTEDMDRNTRRGAIAQLAGDVARALMVNENPPLSVWGGLAVQTLLQSADVHGSDTTDPFGMIFLAAEILYRVQQNNPYQVAFI